MREGRLGAQRHSYVPPESLIEGRTQINPRGGDDRHARAERDVGRRIVHDDLDWYSLADLGAVAGGLLGPQQRERGASPRLDALDMTVDLAFGIGVDRDHHRIAGPHVVELNLLKFAVTQISSGTNVVRLVPGWAN